KEIAYEKDMLGKKVLVTAGPTREKIDSVRYITNYSTGKMGYAIAKHCMQRGAEITLVTGETSIEPPSFVNVIEVTSAKEMFDAVKDNFEEQDIIIKAAAVADYTPSEQREGKIKKADVDLSIQLKRTDDILKYLGEHKKDGQLLCGFSMETENLIQNSRKKLEEKNADMIVANNLTTQGAGFATDTNVVVFITKDKVVEFPIMTKEEVAENIINFILARS
ncbi:MAG TPA: bifunctional phosphopantothenoylcysteine decarboxylase/phosphopantothenate--cysteine ligase CoaBC, partial [Clostridiales bacterium]|nr:bifunctional phosphopantothenoylcysteine decarboxylase/phosphopantothenate--cysteine ligase CoaBC [Clostridiales bacterium]